MLLYIFYSNMKHNSAMKITDQITKAINGIVSQNEPVTLVYTSGYLSPASSTVRVIYHNGYSDYW